MKLAQHKRVQGRQLLKGKEREGKGAMSLKQKKKEQEANSRVTCQSERKLYLDAVTLLFANLSRESFSS